ncbi:MAG: hypothetical protein ACREH8_09115 [Opitutaceae bacterium]
MPAQNQRRPWPMKWIIIAIVLIIVPYTVLTLRYRRPGPAFQPYEDMKNRANVARLLDAGFRRISIRAQQSADNTPSRGGAVITTTDGGLPPELRSTLVEMPLLPAEITSVTAAPNANTLQSYEIAFTYPLPDDRQQPGGAELFVRGESIVIMPTFEPVAGDLRARSQQASVQLTIPAGVLKPGNYTVTLAGQRASRSWPLEVK